MALLHTLHSKEADGTEKDEEEEKEELEEVGQEGRYNVVRPRGQKQGLELSLRMPTGRRNCGWPTGYQRFMQRAAATTVASVARVATTALLAISSA